ncbi:DUF5692 family protein [Paenibacillus sp. CMAA1364]
MRKSKLWIMLFSFLLALVYLPSVSSADSSSTKELTLGTWQGIVDGSSSEGSFFYRMEFNKDGTVSVLKQYGGNNVKEQKTWVQTNNSIEVTSETGAVITDFDGASLLIEDASKSISYQNGDYIGVISKHNRTLSVIHWVLILVVLIALNELFRRYKWFSIVFFFILPIVLLPLWMSYGVTHWFKWVKVYSVVAASVWFILMRFTGLGKYNFAKMVAALFLAINIAEAVTQDFSMAFLPNILNGIAGILSIITLFYGWKGIQADRSKQKDLVWSKMTIFWIIAYDLWNWVFVYLNFPGSASAQFMVLLACTIPAMFIKKGTWLQARAFTLAAWFMYYFTFARFTEATELLVPRNDFLMLFVAILSISANAIYAAVYFRKLYIERKQLRIAE